MSSRRVVVVGAGVVGLSCADELVRGGHEVTVVDPAPAAGATRAAAGMLGPAGEAWFGEERLLRLGLDSAARWPAFAASLEARTGHDVDLRTIGTLLVGLDHDDLTRARRTAALLADHQIDTEFLDRQALRRVEPTLSSRACGGVLLPHDHWVNPRRVAAALLTALGARVRTGRAVGETAGGVRLEDGTQLPADVVVRATGATGLPRVRRVRGEIVRVRCDDPPQHTVRAWVHGEPVYVVPRAGGEVVVGATQEEHGRSPDDPHPTVAGTARLLDLARALLPGLDTADVLEVLARDRPGTPDNGPLIGPLIAPATGAGPAEPGAPRVVLAVGHYRGGVLLAPVTAVAVRAYVEGGTVPLAALPFTADRFDER